MLVLRIRWLWHQCSEWGSSIICNIGAQWLSVHSVQSSHERGESTFFKYQLLKQISTENAFIFWAYTYVCQVVQFLHAAVFSYVVKLILYYILLGLPNYEVNKVSRHCQVSNSGHLGCTLDWAVRCLLLPMEAHVQFQGGSCGVCDRQSEVGKVYFQTLQFSLPIVALPMLHIVLLSTAGIVGHSTERLSLLSCDDWIFLLLWNRAVKIVIVMIK
jgi:hypothetical protein